MQEQGRKKYQAINMHVHFANKHTERLHRLNSDPENRCKHVPSQLALFLHDGGSFVYWKTHNPTTSFKQLLGLNSLFNWTFTRFGCRTKVVPGLQLHSSPSSPPHGLHVHPSHRTMMFAEIMRPLKTCNNDLTIGEYRNGSDGIANVCSWWYNGQNKLPRLYYTCM